jgi:hypothetical protein
MLPRGVPDVGVVVLSLPGEEERAVLLLPPWMYSGMPRPVSRGVAAMWRVVASPRITVYRASSNRGQ